MKENLLTTINTMPVPNKRFGASGGSNPVFAKNLVPYRLQTNKKCYLCR